MRLDRFLGQRKRLGRRGVRLLLAAGRVTVDGRVIQDGRWTAWTPPTPPTCISPGGSISTAPG